MSRLLLTKKFVFEMAHALPDYDGKCSHLHGHSYHLEVTVDGGDPTALGPDGMAMDFHKLKELVQKTIVDRFDHALVLPCGSPLSTLHAPLVDNLIEVPFQPTTENLLLHFSNLLAPQLPTGTRLHSLRLAETETSVAELLL